MLNILPKMIADELKTSGKATAKRYDHVSILFTDFKDFTVMSSSMSPDKLVKELNEIYSHFDDIMEEYQMEKVQTIGDAYFAACGVPEENKDHAFKCIEAAKQMFRYLEERNKKTKSNGRCAQVFILVRWWQVLLVRRNMHMISLGIP